MMMISVCIMRRRGVLRKFLSVGLVLIFMVSGTVSASSSENDTSSFYKFTSANVGRVLAELTLVGLEAASKARALTNVTTTTTTTTTPPAKITAEVGSNRAGRAATSTFKRSSKDLPQKQTTASNALLANIDFLTQLTNSKQDKNTEIDPLKCFPKALCGLSAESAAITRRRKNSLITDYIRLMKAVALNPNVMEKTLRKLNRHELAQQDDVGEDSDSDEEGEDDEEEDRIRSHANHNHDIGVNRRSYGYGYNTGNTEQTPEHLLPSKKRTKRKETIPKDSSEFTRQFLQEKAHVERLMDDGFHNEDTDATNWWAYEKEQDPSLEALVDFSGTKLDSSSAESYYTFGSKRKPNPPIAPPRPDAPEQPQAPQQPLMSPPGAPPIPRPPPTPLVRMPENLHDNHEASSSNSAITSIGRFFRNLLGFGGFSRGDTAAFQRDPFFEGFKRSMPDGTPTIVTVDKTKEILTTAIEIGETLRSPNQCNSLFNGCQYQYIELLHVIDDIRQNLADKGREEYENSELRDEENDDEIDEGSSYGYKSSLSKVSQAETLSPDYTATSSKVTGKKEKRNKKKKGDPHRDGKMGSDDRDHDHDQSKESSVEIGSDEPTLYGSGQQNFDFVRQRHGKHGLQQNHHQNHHHNHHHTRPQYPHHSSESPYPYYSQSYHSPYGQPSSYDNMFVRQPKTIWTTILSWFGFRRK